jgi:carbon monoxide dehydrogenase subunit G
VKLEGKARLPGTRQQVWEFLTDPARLVKCMPGAENVEAVGPDRYKVGLKFGIAAISGNYAGVVELAEKKPPASLVVRVDGKGAAGFMKGEGRLELAEKQGETEVKYTGEAQVGGLIASVGQRMIEAAARKIVEQFFENAKKAVGGS